MTNEARLLKKWRLDRGLTLREVGQRVGKNHATIAHIEGGRMGVPTGEFLERLLTVYGITNVRSLPIMAKCLDSNLSTVERITELLEKMRPEQVEIVFKVTREIAEGRATILV
ncbi:MAG: helix-turn-helix domain-containing protein [Oligoflexales bacterium]